MSGPTRIDGAEVYDSQGPLILKINGFDVATVSYLRERTTGDYPVLTEEDINQINGLIMAVLNVRRSPEV